MYPIADDLLAAVEALPDPTRMVVVEASPTYQGELVFQALDPQGFLEKYPDWVSRYLVLNELYNLAAFVEQLEEDGWSLIFGESCRTILADYQRWSEPLEIEGYDLHGFQQFSLNRAFEQRFWFFNWATGAGKSFVSAAGAKELFARDEIDLVLAFTISRFKINQQRYYAKAGLDAVVNDGSKPKRRKGYLAGHQVYVANYQKAWVDYDELVELTKGKRVLYILDECHLVISGENKPNRSRQAIDKLRLLSGDQSRVWPMSASVVGGNPLRFRDVYSIGSLGQNPLGSRTDFIRRYADEVKNTPVKTRTGQSFTLTSYDWSLPRLQEIRHRVGDRTQAVRKTDPAIRQYFRGLATIVEPVQMSDEDRFLTNIIIEKAREAHGREESLAPYYSLLRYVANISTALSATTDEVGREIAKEHSELISASNSAKLEALNDKLEEIREAGDKVVVFTHYTHLGLHLITPHIKVPHVVHFGTGQTTRESQEAQDQFKADPDITAFMTSDAGSHGLNMQCARYCIQIEPTYDYDLGIQRASRIDRSDSHLDGLTNYVLLCDDSVEERVWSVNQSRRELAAAVQGTQEVLSYGDADLARRSEAENLSGLIFGGNY